MTYCSNYAFGLTYGVAYSFTTNPGECICKGTHALTADSVANELVHSALTTNLNLNPDLQCQYPNGSTQTATNGSEYQIYCSAEMPEVNDLCPFTSPTASTPINNTCPTHANSLQDCMNQCSAAHPLCLAVTYIPDMEYGYGNCYFKNNISIGSITPTSGNDVRHLALANSDLVFNTDSDCTNGTSYTSPNEAEFETLCNQDIPTAYSVAVYHMSNLSACADACATYSNSSGLTCVAAAFDSTLVNGYLNCYLKSNLNGSVAINGKHMALLTRAADGKSTNSSLPGPASSTPDPKSPGSSRNHTWIAGPVVGGVVGAFALAGLLYWLRSRQRSTQTTHYSLAPVLQSSPGYTPPPPRTELDVDRPRQELPGDFVMPEMPEKLHSGSE